MLEGIDAILFDIGSTLKVMYEWIWEPDARPCLKRLAPEYRLFICANQPTDVRQLMAATGMTQYFDHIYISEETGFLKPDSAFFLHILQHEHLIPEHVVMVGDELENDIEPAQKLGIRTVWVRRGLGLRLALANGLEAKIKPDYIVNSLDEIK